MCIYVYVICRKEGGSQFFTIRTDPMPVNNFFSKLSNEKKKKNHGKKLTQALL